MWPLKIVRKDDGEMHMIYDEDDDGYVWSLFLLLSDPGWPLASDTLHLPDPRPPAAAHHQ